MMQSFKVVFTICIFTSCIFFYGCYDPFGYELESMEWDIEKSEHFVYHYFSSDFCFHSPEQARDKVLISLEELENFLDWFCEFFDVNFDEKQIYYYKYPTIADLKKTFGEEWSENWIGCAGIYGRKEIHTVHNVHKHEVVHIISWEINHPSLILSEGLAERYEEGNVFSWVLHTSVAEEIRAGRFISLRSGVTCRQFREIDVTEQCRTFRREVASWTAYLIDLYGINKFRDFFQKTHKSCWSEHNIFNTIYEVYGKTFDDMESEWITFLEEEYLEQPFKITYKAI